MSLNQAASVLHTAEVEGQEGQEASTAGAVGGVGVAERVASETDMAVGVDGGEGLGGEGFGGGAITVGVEAPGQPSGGEGIGGLLAAADGGGLGGDGFGSRDFQRGQGPQPLALFDGEDALIATGGGAFGGGGGPASGDFAEAAVVGGGGGQHRNGGSLAQAETLGQDAGPLAADDVGDLGLGPAVVGAVFPGTGGGGGIGVEAVGEGTVPQVEVGQDPGHHAVGSLDQYRLVEDRGGAVEDDGQAGLVGQAQVVKGLAAGAVGAAAGEAAAQVFVDARGQARHQGALDLLGQAQGRVGAGAAGEQEGQQLGIIEARGRAEAAFEGIGGLHGGGFDGFQGQVRAQGTTLGGDQQAGPQAGETLGVGAAIFFAGVPGFGGL